METNDAEERRQTMKNAEHEVPTGNVTKEQAGARQLPKQQTPTVVTSTVGVQLQFQGNVTNSQIRQNNSPAPQPPAMTTTVAKQPQGTVRSTTTVGGSSQRKRSRVGEEGMHGVQMPANYVTKMHEYVNIMNLHIENLQKTGQKGNTGTVRVQMSETIKDMATEATNLLAKLVNTQEIQINLLKVEKLLKDKILMLQDENNNIKVQVIELQQKLLNKEQVETNENPPTYAQMITRNMASKIVSGNQLPLPQVPQSIKHAPAECVIIFKAEQKGEMKNKQEQEKFRKEVKELLSEEERQGISAIRPTRFGGYTVIFQNERCRDTAYEKLKENERENGVSGEASKMVAPTKKVAKVVCKEVPDGISIEQIKQDMFGKHNPALQTVNNMYRTGKVYRTRLGLIFELSCYEMAAIQNQGWKIRCDLGRELRVEEFISLQQCYACAKFGHSAVECKSEDSMCRLCGKAGHAGKDCPDKDNKELWRCINCQRMNQLKNMNLDVKHAAAQLHRCPVALQQKNLRKIQLAATGVFTTQIQKGDELLRERPRDADEKQMQHGAQKSTFVNEGRGNKNRSRSLMRRRNNIVNNVRANFRGELRQSQIRERTDKDEEMNPCVQRKTKTPRPPQENGWQTVGRKYYNERISSQGGESSSSKGEGANEGQEEDEEIMQTPMEGMFVDDED